MTHPTGEAAPHQTLDALVAEAQTATEVLPTIDRCRHLDTQLRDAIRDLHARVEEKAAGLTPRSRAWYACVTLTDRTDEVLAGSLGYGLLSAATRVAALARHCRSLADACEAMNGR